MMLYSCTHIATVAHCCYISGHQRVKPSFVIFDIWALTLSPERQSARMSKITSDGLTRSLEGCFIAVYPHGNSGRQRVNRLTRSRVYRTPPHRSSGRTTRFSNDTPSNPVNFTPQMRAILLYAARCKAGAGNC